jgi:penicillin-binding protein 1A
LLILMRYVARLALVLVLGVATMVGAVVGMVPAWRHVASGQSFADAEVKLPPLGERSLIFDQDGQLIGSFQDEQNRSIVSLSAVPQDVIDSVLAVEDATFFQHGPVDVRSVVRALFTNVRAGGVAQGGSTITQQLVKKSLTGDKVDLKRKLQEAYLAVRLEEQMSKQQILERYLNTVYFGNGAYGVQAASEVYFGHDVGQDNWAEAALLAALISNPNNYEPIQHPQEARAQRTLAFKRLVDTHKLDQQQVDYLEHVPLPTRLNLPQSNDDYFVETVKQRLLSGDTPEGRALGPTPEARYNALFRGGLRIYTTYDRGAQLQAIAARQQTVPGIRPDGTFPLPDYVTASGVHQPQFGTAVIVGVDPSSGAVRVLLGGPGFDRVKYDIATHPPGKQPGSSFKTFVLSAAIENGYVPNDVINGTSPCTYSADDPNTNQPTKYTLEHPQTVHNFAGERGDVGTLTRQTLQSSNCAFLRLGQIVGLKKVIQVAQAMGITNCATDDPSPPASQQNCLNPNYPVMAFGGTAGVLPLDMADAYATLANDGMHNDAYFVDKIDDRNGKVLYQHEVAPRRAVSSQTARLVTQVLEANVLSGTGTRARLANGQPAAGKTGTTDEAKNIWFVGYTPQLATAVWIGDGADAEVPLFGGSATGGQYAAYTWGAFMEAYLTSRNLPVTQFLDAAPTRPGTRISIGPGDGQPFGHAGDRSEPQDGRTGGSLPSTVTTLP